MIFDTHFWIFTIFWALISASIACALTWPGKFALPLEPIQPATKRTATTTFVIALLALRCLMYYGMPVFQGSFFGYWEVLSVTIAVGVTVALTLGKPIPGAKGYVALTALALIATPALMLFFSSNWGQTNSARFADLPNIKIAAPDATMPPTDPSHMVLVPRSVAIFEGSKKLQGEISSRYKIDKESYTMQSVAGHRYWIAPLTLINTGDTLNLTNPESPGYVVVDAESTKAEAELKLGYRIKLFNDQQWQLLVQRQVYQQGYTDRTLGRAFSEVDDQWQPYWTFGYFKKPFGGMAGLSLDKIIMVNVSSEEPEVTVASPKDKPDWLDRVLDEDIVRQYAIDWGMYGRGHSENYWSIFFNWNKEGTLQPADVELNYTSNEENVWIVPMTSTTGSHAVQGVLVFETNKNQAIYYPGLNDFYIGDSVRRTMANANDNIMHYSVENPQLFSINGELTWVGIYVSPQENGMSFAGIGLLHAHNQNSADVIVSNNKTTVLSQYANQLAMRRKSGQLVSKTADVSKQLRARVGRIAPLPSTSLTNSAPTYLFAIDGESRTFRIGRDTYSRIPLVKEGDEIEFNFFDTSEEEESVISFQCIKCAGMELSKPAEGLKEPTHPEEKPSE